MTKTSLAEPDPSRCIVVGCTEVPERDVIICATHAKALTPVTASAPPACGCQPGRTSCAQHEQVGQGRGPRRARRS
jgi:hypothetical protein